MVHCDSLGADVRREAVMGVLGLRDALTVRREEALSRGCKYNLLDYIMQRSNDVFEQGEGLPLCFHHYELGFGYGDKQQVDKQMAMSSMLLS